jgi:hypothetical protein
MHPTLVRILKQGIPVAAVLALVGYVMAEAAGMWVGGQAERSSVRVTMDAPGAPDVSGEDLSRVLRTRLPFTLALWGFGIVVVFELVLSVWRGNRAAKPVAAVPTEDEVETLLNQLLRQAESAEAARAAQPQTDTPPPADPITPCPSAAPAENSTSPVGDAR